MAAAAKKTVKRTATAAKTKARKTAKKVKAVKKTIKKKATARKKKARTTARKTKSTVKRGTKRVTKRATKAASAGAKEGYEGLSSSFERLYAELQARTKTFLEAEDGVAATAKTLLEGGIPVNEVRSTMEEFLGRFPTKDLWVKVTEHERVVKLSQYRSDLEQRIETVVERISGGLPIASAAELDKQHKALERLQRRVRTLEKELKLS